MTVSVLAARSPGMEETAAPGATSLRLSGESGKRVAVPLSPADRHRLTRTGPFAVRAVAHPGGSAGAKLEVEHDGAPGGVVRDVRARRLTLGGSSRCTVRGGIVEVGLEHAEIR